MQLQIANTITSMPAFDAIIVALWFFSALADYIYFTHLWQIKEYRLDRFCDFLQTAQGRSFKYSYRILFRPLTLLFLYTFLNAELGNYLLIFVILLADLPYNLYNYKKKVLKRPVFTLKAASLIIIALLLEGYIFYTFHLSSIGLLYLVLRYFIFSGIVLFFQWPTKVVKYLYIFLAKRKIQRYPQLITIGITGSYGKSSVKEFASHILSGKYNVIKTPKNINTEIGVAKFILSNKFEDKEVFVCEMGAYKMGEIKKICKMVNPKIGILTAINEQHLTLFGAIEKTQKAKYELLNSISEDGLVITNADNPYCVEFLEQLKCKNQMLFGMDEDNNPNWLITHINWGLAGGKYDINFDSKSYHVEVPIIGQHHAMNLVPAMAASKFIGMEMYEIIEQAKTLPKNTHGSLHIYSYGKATIIDDSYNSNPKGFCSALDVMGKFSPEKRRVVITRGMLELGDRSAELHEQVGGEIAFVADGLVVTTRDSYELLKRGVGSKYQTQISLKTNRKELLKYLQTLKDQEVVILLENRMPTEITKELAPYKSAKKTHE